MLKDRFIQLIPYSLRKHLRNAYEFSKKGSLKKLHSQFIHPGALVFDIGGNNGFYAQSFLDLGAKVICVEPQPCCIQMLRQKFKNSPDIKILELGVADKCGELVLHMDSKNNTTATFSEKFMKQGPFKNRNWGEDTAVPMTTLDDLIRAYGKPEYCKIDIEGYEPQALQGLSTPVPYLSFEYYQGFMDDIDLCLSHLEKLGEMHMNFAPNFDFTRLALKEWTPSKPELLAKITSSSLHYAGDIFVKFV